jgi:hypothetical protein
LEAPSDAYAGLLLITGPSHSRIERRSKALDHKQIAHFRAVERAIKQRILAMHIRIRQPKDRKEP